MSDELLRRTGSLSSEGTEAPAGAMDVWLHPQRTLLLLERMARDLGYIPELRDGLREAASLLEAQRMENVALSARNTGLATRLQQCRRELESTRQQLDDAQAKIEEYAELEQALQQFAEQLQGAEVMKRNYEQRLRTLRAQLRDARDALRTVTGIDYSDDLKVIDMETSGGSVGSSYDQGTGRGVGHVAAQPPLNAPPPPAPPEPERPRWQPRRKPSPYLPPAEQRGGSDDSDWLVELPGS